MAGKMQRFQIAEEQLNNIENLGIESVEHSYRSSYTVKIISGRKEHEVISGDIFKKAVIKCLPQIRKEAENIYREKMPGLYKEAAQEAYEFMQGVSSKSVKNPDKKKIWDYVDLDEK